MSSALVNAAPLKAEIRLAQAVSQFEADLSTEQKAAFRSYRSKSCKSPPDIHDVMRLTAEIDRHTSEKFSAGRCFGPRLTNVLQAVQQFAALGDIIVGGAQNIIASGVWTLLVSISDSDMKTYKSELDGWGNSIKEEVSLLVGQNIEEQSSRLKALSRFSESESRRQKLKAHVRVLDYCSTYDYQTTWKEIRKVGNATLFNENPEYQDWKAGADSCTLVCTGKLGSGKSVLLANIVDDLHLHVQSAKCPVAYFFCRHDISESLKARTVICSLARQLLRPIPDLTMVEQLIDKTASVLDFEGILKFLRCALPPDFKAYIVLDGLDECHDLQRPILIQQLRKLQAEFALLICVSFRLEADNALRLGSEQFAKHSTIAIPEDNPDIGSFISAELERCIESRKLTIGDPTLILEIEDALLQGAQGMFLWVALQIESLCAAKTDEAIRQALADLPKDLPETFSRILQRSGESGKHYQMRTFELVTAAHRPLTTEELRESLSVVPGHAVWNPARLLNDVYSALACCGSLVTVDEEESTSRRQPNYNIGKVLADASKLFKSPSVHQFQFYSYAKSYWLQHARYISEHEPVIYNLLLKLLKQEIVNMDTRDDEGRALLFWAAEKGHDAIVKLLVEKGADLEIQDTFGQTPLWYGVRNAREAVIKLLLEKGANIESRSSDGPTPLSWAAQEGHEAVVKLLLEKGANIEWSTSDGLTPLSLAAKEGHEAVVKLLVEKGANLETEDIFGQTPVWYGVRNAREAVIKLLVEAGPDLESKDSSGQTPLSFAAREGDEAVVKLLVEKGANLETKDIFDQTPLWYGVKNSREAVIKLLVEAGADLENKNSSGQTPLSFAAREGHEAVVKLLVEKGANLETKDTFNQTPLWYGVRNAREAVIKLLVEAGAALENKDSSGQRPLSFAAREGHEAVIKLLLDNGANIESKDSNHLTPLLWAAREGHEAVVKLLLEKGANIESEDERSQYRAEK
ncbi:hypothetical protein DL767_010342 [Monosporascus sp. MG133]|nr:hypothetical protein DL767_010342 [Monosporascus sp. MG133]